MEEVREIREPMIVEEGEPLNKQTGTIGNRVSVSETVGATFLGILSLILLVLLGRSEARNRSLLAQPPPSRGLLRTLLRRIGLARS